LFKLLIIYTGITDFYNLYTYSNLPQLTFNNLRQRFIIVRWYSIKVGGTRSVTGTFVRGRAFLPELVTKQLLTKIHNISLTLANNEVLCIKCYESICLLIFYQRIMMPRRHLSAVALNVDLAFLFVPK
jgi:hypothetical protein